MRVEAEVSSVRSSALSLHFSPHVFLSRGVPYVLTLENTWLITKVNLFFEVLGLAVSLTHETL